MTSVTIFDIKRFAVHDGPGIRTTVFMKGCPMDCWWCHNPESRSRAPEEVTYIRKLGKSNIESKKVYGKIMSTDEVMDEIFRDNVFHEESGGGITFSGGEPLHQPEALAELLEQCKNHGLHTTVDTCGYTQWKNFEKILPYTDLFLYDLKVVDPEGHQKFTGVKNELILENLDKLLEKDAAVELRIPVIPGINNFAEELQRFVQFLMNSKRKIGKIHLLPYHRTADSKYKKLNLENRMISIENNHGLDIQVFKKELTSHGFQVGIGG